MTVNGVTDKATAWSTTAPGDTNTQLDTAYLGVYSGGLGVTNKDGTTVVANPCLNSGSTLGKDCGEGTKAQVVSPEHATDNNQRFDAVLFSFTDTTSAAVKVQLTQVALGFPAVNGGTNCSGTSACDSDITVLAYTGQTTPGALSSITPFSYTQMTAAGWTLVGNYADVADTSNRTANINTGSTPISSAYWIVAAFDPNLSSNPTMPPCTQVGTITASTYSPGCTYDSTNGGGKGNDYVKILWVATNPTKKAPEPNTLLLLGLAGTLGVWTKRRFARR